jgi:hypothetical protein
LSEAQEKRSNVGEKRSGVGAFFSEVEEERQEVEEKRCGIGEKRPDEAHPSLVATLKNNGYPPRERAIVQKKKGGPRGPPLVVVGCDAVRAAQPLSPVTWSR